MNRIRQEIRPSARKHATSTKNKAFSRWLFPGSVVGGWWSPFHSTVIGELYLVQQSDRMETPPFLTEDRNRNRDHTHNGNRNRKRIPSLAVQRAHSVKCKEKQEMTASARDGAQTIFPACATRTAISRIESGDGEVVGCPNNDFWVSGYVLIQCFRNVPYCACAVSCWTVRIPVRCVDRNGIEVDIERKFPRSFDCVSLIFKSWV